ncbi:hypothetical protein [Subtercola vilae]|uniref:PBP domain-containing protein n=1 Tax=Subtercola vilae TaxID=2056433 RepID=A0A4T2BP27_9MICO|nr:hypothetical protein [Subtercola vilae]TIH33463.1 hypothetical protein D4765_14780 [Subtercola vilae]
MPRRRSAILQGLSGVLVGGAVFALVALTGAVIPAQSARADVSSAVTVSAYSQDADIADAPMKDLVVTVSQTKDLMAQGIQVSWKGGLKSEVPSGQTGGANFLQIAQCWGDLNGHTDEPDRTTCQYGAFNTPGASRDSFISPGTTATADLQYTAPSSGPLDPAYTSIPFVSATGVTVASVVNPPKAYPKGSPNIKDESVDVNNNQFFTKQTSNEISWAGSGANGSGSVKFEVQTAAQSPGLGCGTRIAASDGTETGSSCWLVIIPRGTADTGEQNITKSGLFSDAWKHRVAIRLDFKPIGVSCTIGSAERQLAGSELVSGAVSSWQPALCGAAGGAAYTIISGSESDALQAASSTVEQPMALTSRPLSQTADTGDPLIYAPIALTGISISFAIDREPSAIKTIPQTSTDNARTPFTSLNLTPRLLAKLLTNSYLDSLPTGADKSQINYKSPTDPGNNARNLTLDKDFLAINDPEWADQQITSPALADLLEPQGRSDAAFALWSYVLSDPEAVDFLAGKPDPWGMIVNPYSSTDASKNPTGVALVLPRDNFPKADPVEQPKDPAGAAAVNVVTWRPYTNDFDTSGYLILRGDGQILGPWDSLAATPKYTKTARALAGLQRVIGITDTASAAKYQTFSASLRNSAGVFVAPTTASLSAAGAAMTENASQAQVSQFDPTSSAARATPTAYPLTLPVYAAVNPAMGDDSLRADYAAFIRYAVTTGQVSGTALGQLPEGYAPIPAAWQGQALAAATIIANGPLATPVASPSPSPVSAPAAAVSKPVAVAALPAVQPVTAAAPTITDPAATGQTAAPLLGAPTPADPQNGAIAAAVPASILAGLGAAFAFPFMSRIRRRP